MRRLNGFGNVLIYQVCGVVLVLVPTEIFLCMLNMCATLRILQILRVRDGRHTILVTVHTESAYTGTRRIRNDTVPYPIV